MKQTLILAFATLALGAPIALHAQTTSAPAATESRPHLRTPDQVVARYAERLQLTDDQKVKIKPIVEERQRKIEELRSESGPHRMGKLKAIVEDCDTRIKAVLTPDQQKKYDAMEAEQRERMKERAQKD